MKDCLKYFAAIALSVAGCDKAGRFAVTGEVLEGNSIEICSKKEGLYTLVYVDGYGQPLADFTPICVLDNAESGRYEDFIDVNVAPREAESIAIYDSEAVERGTIDISQLKSDRSDEMLYSFGLLSDVHLGREEIFPDADFANALDVFESEDVIWTCICGDITQDGLESELQTYRELVAPRKSPVYVVAGNHDCTTSGNEINSSLWTGYTGLPLVYEKSVSTGDRTDHFLFLSMSYYNFVTPYLESHLSWLGNKLETYKNDRCFVFTHLFFPDRAGNLNDIYPYQNWLSGVQLEWLEGLCEKYVNTMWFSGHSHWQWGLQKYQDRANIHREYLDYEPVSGWCVHVPSCGVPITSDGTTREGVSDGSEGAIVRVYETHVDVYGIDFKAGKYLPVAVYRLEME